MIENTQNNEKSSVEDQPIKTPISKEVENLNLQQQSEDQKSGGVEKEATSEDQSASAKLAEGSNGQENVHEQGGPEETAKEKITIEFPYSHIAREKAPKVFEFAENVATQWVNNEKFENLGLPHPLADIAVGKALDKAKEVEKKLEEKGVISAAKMGYQIAKIQTQSLLSKIKKS